VGATMQAARTPVYATEEAYRCGRRPGARESMDCEPENRELRSTPMEVNMQGRGGAVSSMELGGKSTRMNDLVLGAATSRNLRTGASGRWKRGEASTA